MLRKFHDTWYAPNNAILIIVGDVEPAQALEQVKKLFGGIPPAKLPARPEFQFRTGDAGNAEAGYRPPLRHGRHHVPAARLGQPGLRRGANPVGRVEQPARQALRAGAGRQGAVRGLRVRQPAEGRPGLRHCRVSRGRRFNQSAGPGAGHPGGGSDQRRHGGPGGSGQTPRNRQRRTAEEFRVRPGFGVVASGRGRGPAIAGRRHRRHPAGHGGRRESRGAAVSGFWITPSRPSSRRNLPASPFPQRALAARNRSPPRKPKGSSCRPGREKVNEQIDNSRLHAESRWSPICPTASSSSCSRKPSATPSAFMAGSKTIDKVQMPPGQDGVDQALDQLVLLRHEVTGPPGLSKGAGRHRRERIRGHGFLVVRC